MSFSKTKIFNVALSAMLLAKELTDSETDQGNEARILRLNWEVALESTLSDLDLDSTSTPATLELIEVLSDQTWNYVYKYPTDCAFFRRLESGFVTDNKSTHIPKRVAIFNGQRGIFTNQADATIEYIPKSINLSALSSMVGMAIGYQLAFLSSPLVVGKGASKVRENIFAAYLLAKTEAQEKDALENFNYEDESLRSEFVTARLS